MIAVFLFWCVRTFHLSFKTLVGLRWEWDELPGGVLKTAF